MYRIETRNPLQYLWNLFGTLGAIISLSSMVESWFEDTIKWKGFIAQVLTSYRSLTEPVIEALFGWLPFTVPYWIADYLFIGILFLSIVLKHRDLAPTVFHHGYIFHIRRAVSLKVENRLSSKTTIIDKALVPLLWPLFLIIDINISVRGFLVGKYDRQKELAKHEERFGIFDVNSSSEECAFQMLEFIESDMEKRNRLEEAAPSMNTIQWFLAIMLGVIILLSINTQIEVL